MFTQRTLQNLHEKIALQIALDRCEELCLQVRLRCQNQSVLSETRQRFKTWDERENCTEAEMAVEHSLANEKEKKKSVISIYTGNWVLLAWGEDYVTVSQRKI